VVRDNGSAGQFSLAWSDGVLDDWSIEKTLPDTLYARPNRDRFHAAYWLFKTLLSIPDYYPSTPLLQQPRDLTTGFWPPSRGSKQSHVLWAWIVYFSYLNDELFIREMDKAFRSGIPPIAIILGRFLVISGCIHVKSFYGAEGHFRIEGEKPKDTETAVKWANEMLDETTTYLIKKENEFGNKS